VLSLEAGFEAVEWDRLITEMETHMQPVVNGEVSPVLLVEGTMVLNYRFMRCLCYRNSTSNK